MDWVKCNTKEGIETMITSLADFNRLVAMRKECAKLGNLSIFYLFGRFELDPRGYLLKWQPNFFADEMYDTITPVLTHNEFMELFNAYAIHKDQERVCDDDLPAIPPARMIDPLSGHGWTIDTCHDAYPVKDVIKIDLDPYVGKRLGDVKAMLADDEKKLYLFETLRILPEDDNSAYDDTDDERYEESQKPRIFGDDYIIASGDIGYVAIVNFFHHDTLQQFQVQHAEKFVSDVELTLLRTLEYYGFSDATIEQASIPTRLVHCGKYISDLSWVIMFYFRVNTVHVHFGIMLLHDDSVVLDLYGSGVTSHELSDAAGELPNQERPADLCFVTNSVLEVLHDVML